MWKKGSKKVSAARLTLALFLPLLLTVPNTQAVERRTNAVHMVQAAPPTVGRAAMATTGSSDVLHTITAISCDAH